MRIGKCKRCGRTVKWEVDSNEYCRNCSRIINNNDKPAENNKCQWPEGCDRRKAKGNRFYCKYHFENAYKLVGYE